MPSGVSPIEFEYVRQRTLNIIYGFESRLSETEISEYPSASAKKLILVVRRILNATDTRVKSSSDLNTILRYFQLVTFLSPVLDFLDNAKTEQTPRGLVKLIEQLIGNGVEIIASPQSEFNYSVLIITNAIKEAIENSFDKNEKDQIFNDIPEIRLVRFPRIQRDNILLHTIFGHEIGHDTADKYLIYDQSTPEYNKQLQLAHSEILKIIQSDPTYIKSNKTEKLKILNANVQTVLKIRDRALQELVSDSVCITMLGPAGLFGLYDLFIVGGNIDQPPMRDEFYPPSRYRIRWMFQILEKGGYFTELRDLKKHNVDEKISVAFTNFISNFEDIIKIDNDIKNINSQPLIKIAYQWIENIADATKKYVENEIKKLTYDPKLIAERVPNSISRLCCSVPANEIGLYPSMQRSDWVSAILAGWIIKAASKFTNDVSPLVTDITDEALQGLTLAAIEYTTLTKDYENWNN